MRQLSAHIQLQIKITTFSRWDSDLAIGCVSYIVFHLVASWLPYQIVTFLIPWNNQFHMKNFTGHLVVLQGLMGLWKHCLMITQKRLVCVSWYILATGKRTKKCYSKKKRGTTKGCLNKTKCNVSLSPFLLSIDTFDWNWMENLFICCSTEIMLEKSESWPPPQVNEFKLYFHSFFSYLLFLCVPLAEGFQSRKTIFERKRLYSESDTKPILQSHWTPCKICNSQSVFPFPSRWLMVPKQ